MPSLVFGDVQRTLNRKLGPGAGLADLAEAVLYALRLLGVTPQSNSSVSPIDLASLSTSDANQLLDVAHWRCLSMVLLNADDQALRENGIAEEGEKFRARYERQREVLTQFCKYAYGLGLPTLQGGVLELDFAAANDNPPDAVPS